MMNFSLKVLIKIGSSMWVSSVSAKEDSADGSKEKFQSGSPWFSL